MLQSSFFLDIPSPSIWVAMHQQKCLTFEYFFAIEFLQDKVAEKAEFRINLCTAEFVKCCPTLMHRTLLPTLSYTNWTVLFEKRQEKLARKWRFSYKIWLTMVRPSHIKSFYNRQFWCLFLKNSMNFSAPNSIWWPSWHNHPLFRYFNFYSLKSLAVYDWFCQK